MSVDSKNILHFCKKTALFTLDKKNPVKIECTLCFAYGGGLRSPAPSVVGNLSERIRNSTYLMEDIA